jgi:hypothetical protein
LQIETEGGHAMRTDRRHIVSALGVALASIFTLGAGATPALAANADACGVVTQHTMAKAFGLTTTIQHKTVLSGPGNPAGVIHERCSAFAYKGSKPTNAAKRRAALLAGTGAEIKIETWVADSTPSAQVWLANFPQKLETLKTQAKAQFVNGPLNGSTYKPPRFSAEAAIGYQGRSGAIRKVRGLWWQRSTGTLLLVNAAQEKSKPLRASLQSLMSGIVPGVF